MIGSSETLAWRTDWADFMRHRHRLRGHDLWDKLAAERQEREVAKCAEAKTQRDEELLGFLRCRRGWVDVNKLHEKFVFAGASVRRLREAGLLLPDDANHPRRYKARPAACFGIQPQAHSGSSFLMGEDLIILRALRRKPEGLNRTQIRELIGKNRSSVALNQALEGLLAMGRISMERFTTGGRPEERWTVAKEAPPARRTLISPGHQGGNWQYH